MKKNEETSWAEIRAMIRETAKSQKETEKIVKETARQMRETEKRFQETERMIKENAKLINGISTSNGEFCEEYFVNSFKANPTFLGEKFDYVLDNLKPFPAVVDDQYDLVLHNGSVVVIIEMKYKAKVSDVKKMFFKLKSYRANYPMFSGYKVYLCLASFRFRDYVKIRAAEEGIVLVQQRGEKIEVVSGEVRGW